tara:strand:- start:105 stop:485 length:381 start_codon:yes stop_codon:yes gene_type:complete
MSIKATITRVAFNAALNILRKAYGPYCNPSQALRRLMCGTAVALSLITARALLIPTGAGLMGAVIFIMVNTIGFNIEHTVFVMLPCFIVAHLLGYFTNIYCNTSWTLIDKILINFWHESWYRDYCH